MCEQKMESEGSQAEKAGQDSPELKSAEAVSKDKGVHLGKSLTIVMMAHPLRLVLFSKQSLEEKYRCLIL